MYGGREMDGSGETKGCIEGEREMDGSGETKGCMEGERWMLAERRRDV